MRKSICYWLLFWCCGCTMAQNPAMIGIRLGSQQIRSSNWINTHDLAQANGTNRQKLKLINIEANYQRQIGVKQFLRFHAGIHINSQKGEGTSANPVSTQSIQSNNQNIGYSLATGIGRSLVFDKFLFQYGLDLTFAFSFPSQSFTTSDYERLSDSFFVRTEFRNYSPGVWGPGLGTFFGLQWNFAPHLYLGLEGRFSFGARFRNFETKRTIDSYDRQGNLTSQIVERDGYRTLYVSTSWWISPPAILLNYQF
ncbi:MAG: hypothetical protein KAY96_02390 [Bacteroidia bacterium]|nr:hypothetical protein [Bacteroidia bacterium]MBP6721483.1 hypothetical protein [Bacteroidia bacterium]MBP8073581.1 hypothetical protein [Bacteroidia bacterium]